MLDLGADPKYGWCAGPGVSPELGIGHSGGTKTITGIWTDRDLDDVAISLSGHRISMVTDGGSGHRAISSPRSVPGFETRRDKKNIIFTFP